MSEGSFVIFRFFVPGRQHADGPRHRLAPLNDI